MSASAFVFLVISSLVVLSGLIVIAVGEGYMYAWGFMLTAFGLLFGYGIVKRHFDAVDAARH